MKQTPETPFMGSLKNTSMQNAYLASAYVWEAKTQRKITELTPDR